MPASSSTRPEIASIGGRQYLWWHRLRPLGRTWFVLLGGAALSPLVTLAFVSIVAVMTGGTLSSFIDGALIILLLTLPLYLGAWLWTWSHMEGRYGATLAVHCPCCGYALEGTPADRPCPECGRIDHTR